MRFALAIAVATMPFDVNATATRVEKTAGVPGFRDINQALSGLPPDGFVVLASYCGARWETVCHQKG